MMSDETLDETAPRDYARHVGERLRAIRRQKGLSLQDVEAASEQEFKASVLGAYERGERAISVPRLQRLAAFYSVPVDQLLPRDPSAPTPMAMSGDLDGVTIDLTRLESANSPEMQLIERYLHSIQVQRQDFNGRVLSIRRDDLRAIACLLNVELDTAASQLDSLGLRVHA